MLVYGVPESMAHNIVPGSARQQGWRPILRSLLVSQVECLTCIVADWIIMPWSQSELVRIFRPCVARPAFRSDCSKVAVCNYVDPWQWRLPHLAHVDYVLVTF